MEHCEAHGETDQASRDAAETSKSAGASIVAGPEARRAARDHGDPGSIPAVVRQTREYVAETVQQGRHKIMEYRQGGLEKVKRDVTGYAREEPATALLLAAGFGLALGWLTAVARR